MSVKTERRFYAANLSLVDEAHAVIGVERVHHVETVDGVPITKIERKAWLISAPYTVHRFSNRKSLDKWIDDQLKGA
jgi:hypothetical protein